MMDVNKNAAATYLLRKALSRMERYLRVEIIDVTGKDKWVTIRARFSREKPVNLNAWRDVRVETRIRRATFEDFDKITATMEKLFDKLVLELLKK